MSSDLVKAAEFYRGLGWVIFPLIGKQPGCKWSQDLPDKKLYALLDKWKPVTGLAVALGKRSGGLVARDFDKITGYETWCNEQPELARTLPTTRTPKPGFHVYAVANRETRTRVFGDGELRGTGSYTALAPSVHPNGGRYAWITEPSAEIPVIDPDLLLKRSDLVSAESRPPYRAKQTNCVTTKQRSVMRSDFDRENTEETMREAIRAFISQDAWVEMCLLATKPTGIGQRNNKLFQYARYLRWVFPIQTDEAVKTELARRWYDLALPVIGTKDFATTEADFARSWGYSWTPGEPFAKRIGKAMARDRFTLGRNTNEDLVMRCHRAAYDDAGESAYILGSRTVAGIVGLSHQTVVVHNRGLQDMGLLSCVQPGRYGRSKATKKAPVWTLAFTGATSCKAA